MWLFKSKKERQLAIKRQFKIERLKEEGAGYKYAAVKLLKGKSPKEIYSYVECSYHFDDSSSFDEGIEQALEDWRKKTGEEYDYMN